MEEGRSWVVEIEKMHARRMGNDELRSKEEARWKKPSIYRVPNWVKDMTNKKNYEPQLVSLGPYHHGEDDLLPMEEHKLRAVMHMVVRSGKTPQQFLDAIEKVANELMDAYDNLDEKWRGSERSRFVDIMVRDGCFLLEIMKGVKDKNAPEDYPSNDPVFSQHSMPFLWVGIRSDMVVIENQLPLLALHKLEAVCCSPDGSSSTPPSKKDINELVLNFMCHPLKKSTPHPDIDDELRLHPLDIFHKNFCGPRTTPDDQKLSWEPSTLSAVELKEAGIHFKKSKTQSLCDVSFKNGVLSLPSVSVHDGTEKIFLNLMAFERLHGATGSYATSYMIFMDNLIDSERDVALLRSKGIIKHLMSSDKKAANLFNILSKGAVLSPFSGLQEVRRNVNKHCANSWNKWRSIFVHNYLSNPWVFISLVAAVILVLATLLQTIYTVLSFYETS